MAHATKPQRIFCGQARSAWTLIELLVVINIIAVLDALLLPVLSEARRTAHATVCMSNLRQVGMGMQNYADEWDGLLPPQGMYEAGYGNIHWFNLLVDYIAGGGDKFLDRRQKNVIAGCPTWLATRNRRSSGPYTGAYVLGDRFGYGMVGTMNGRYSNWLSTAGTKVFSILRE